MDNGLLGEISSASTGRTEWQPKAPEDRYYGHVDVLGYIGATTFAHLQLSACPKYEKHFKTAKTNQSPDWRLACPSGLSGIALATGRHLKTGVRGLMMLTQNTAPGHGRVGPPGPKQSIIKAAPKYLARRRTAGRSIAEPDRTWFALAAYNVGTGIWTTPALAKRTASNPNKWLDVKKILPRLAQKQWYKTATTMPAAAKPVCICAQHSPLLRASLTWVTQPQLEGSAIAESNQHVPGIDKASPFSRRCCSNAARAAP